MKVLLLTETLAPFDGWGRFSRDLASGLRRRGAEVRVAVARKDESADVEQLALLSSPLNFRKTYLLGFWYARRIARHVKAAPPDVVHAIVEPYAHVARLAARSLGAPYVLTLHGSFAVKTLKDAAYRKRQEQAYREARRVVCISGYTRRRLLDRMPLENTEVIPNGLNHDSFPVAAATRGGAPKEHVFITVGAVKSRKGYHLLVPALAALKSRGTSFTWHIVGNQGDEEYVRKVKQSLQDAGLGDRTHWHQALPDKDLASLYATATVFLLTPVSSEYDFEGFGLVYLEANAHGLPAVATRGSGAEEAVVDGKTGLLAKEGDSGDIAACLQRIVSDPALWLELSRGAREWAREMSCDRQAAKYLEAYGGRA